VPSVRVHWPRAKPTSFLPGRRSPPLDVSELADWVRSRLAMARLTLAFLRGMGVDQRRAM
jgi:hypothetical protein